MQYLTKTVGKGSSEQVPQRILALLTTHLKIITALQGMVESSKNDICKKTDSLSTDLHSEIATVRQEVKDWLGPMQQKVDSNADSIKELESSASDHSDCITKLESTISTLQKQVGHLDAKCKDLEGRSRRNNTHNAPI